MLIEASVEVSKIWKKNKICQIVQSFFYILFFNLMTAQVVAAKFVSFFFLLRFRWWRGHEENPVVWVLAEDNSWMEVVVVFESVIIVLDVLLLHYDSNRVSVSSGTMSPHLLLSFFWAVSDFFRPFPHLEEILQSEI